MSRTKKHPYTKAKAVSKHCRNSSGKCSYCAGNRTYKNKKLEFPKQNIIDEWLDKNPYLEIKKQVEQEALELFNEIQREKLSYIFNFYTQQELSKKLKITQWELLTKMKDNSFLENELLEIDEIFVKTIK